MTKPKITTKPWGHEKLWALTQDYAGKILVIKKGHKLSYQYHETKEETIYLLSGAMDLQYETEKGKTILRLAPGDSFHIPPKMKHRMIALDDCEVLEVSTPHLDDVVRLEDDYHRVK